MKKAARTVLLGLTLASASLLSTALAQEVTRTGLIEADIAGRSVSAWTYASAVPADAAEGIEDENQRAVLERVAGTTIHSATFMHRDAMTMGGIVLVPETIYVNLSTRTDHPEGDSVDSVLVKFSLDPETLTLGEETDIEVSWYPVGSSFSDYYALTEGSLSLTSVTVVDGQTLALSGTISGLLSRQTGYDIEHNPDDTVAIEATFVIDEVKSSDLAYELVTQD